MLRRYSLAILAMSEHCSTCNTGGKPAPRHADIARLLRLTQELGAGHGLAESSDAKGSSAGMR